MTAANPPVTPRLEGDWYVLVHYRDLAADDPEQIHWDDEIWRFQERDGRLSWTRHPHVSFRDGRGRTEQLESGDRARSTGAWSPSPDQLAEIRDGLPFDPHESQTKTLRPNGPVGYRSGRAPRASSASAIGFHTVWSVAAVTTLPEFSRQDTLDSGRTDPAQGLTAHRTQSVSADGRELRGTFERDGQLAGDFRMIRMGDEERDR